MSPKVEPGGHGLSNLPLAKERASRNKVVMQRRYRPNVAGILCDAEGRILVAERLMHEGAWQFPQGGIDEGETPLQALHREMWEEIGLRPEHYQVIDQKSGYRYEYPHGRCKNSLYQGQEQTYFLCEFLGSEADITVETEDREFRSLRWIDPKEFRMNWLPAFKRAVYQQVMRDFFRLDLIS